MEIGLTLGNALRRVLPSSLQGAAITSIKIENVLHEFSSRAGVREDPRLRGDRLRPVDRTDIVLNVKQIALKMEGEGAKRLQLSATGPADVKVGDIVVTGDRSRTPALPLAGRPAAQDKLWAGARLRQAEPDGRDRRHGDAGGRGGLCRLLG